MRRRILAAAAAVVLAAFGAVVLVGYARGADARALAGVRTVPVLVVAEKVAAGTPAEQLTGKVRSELLPAKAAATGRVTDLQQLRGQAATVDLQPGEQLLAARFSSPDGARPAGTVAVPAGKQEVSVLLEPQRSVGGRLAAGDTVGIYVSLKEPAASTHAVLHEVLVTQVQGAPAAASTKEAGNGGDGSGGDAKGGAAPQNSLLVTFAVTAQQAEAVVFGQEHGTLWLSLEPKGSDAGGTTVITSGNLYTESYR